MSIYIFYFLQSFYFFIKAFFIYSYVLSDAYLKIVFEIKYSHEQNSYEILFILAALLPNI